MSNLQSIGEQVLLVEDNKSTLMIMSRLLRQRLNCQVLVATSVAEATAVADGENGAQFDLLISDVGLPDGTGHQLVRALKAKFNIKVPHRQPPITRLRWCVAHV
jgi:CheY-like chemotaxis protein